MEMFRMKIALDRFAILACTCLLASCYTSGDRAIEGVTQADASQQIHVGTSTKADVRRAFGDAKVNKFDSRDEVWTYKFTRRDQPKVRAWIPGIGAIMHRPDKHVHELVVQFNPQGVVTQLRVNDILLPGN
jgi:outer membrane protein assembly factor BamE (lipoprotein component of BamABCDE complex)